MNIDKRWLILIAGFLCVVVLVAFSSARGAAQGHKTYKIEPEITVPEYRSDAARAIDAYERLMERYMDMTGKGVSKMGGDMQAVMGKLDAITAKLNELSARMARIEKALGIQPPLPPVVENPPQPKAREPAVVAPPTRGAHEYSPPALPEAPTVENERSARR